MFDAELVGRHLPQMQYLLPVLMLMVDFWKMESKRPLNLNIKATEKINPKLYCCRWSGSRGWDGWAGLKTNVDFREWGSCCYQVTASKPEQ